MKSPDKFKTKFGIGGVSVSSRIGSNDPVYQGVMDAQKVLGGNFPDHVGSIKILPDLKRRPKKGIIAQGSCQGTNQGGSKITIFAGSINSGVDNPVRARDTALDVTLHEIGHSERFREIQNGAWLDDGPDIQFLEADAENFTRESRKKYSRLIRKNSTWR